MRVTIALPRNGASSVSARYKQIHIPQGVCTVQSSPSAAHRLDSLDQSVETGANRFVGVSFEDRRQWHHSTIDNHSHRGSGITVSMAEQWCCTYLSSCPRVSELVAVLAAPRVPWTALAVQTHLRGETELRWGWEIL